MATVAIHVEPRFEHHRYWLGKFADGLKRHGVSTRIRTDFEPIDCDVAVFWSHGNRVKAVAQNQIARGKDYIVLERGYLGDRTKWTSVGLNGHARRANFCNADSPSKRLDSLKFKTEDWSPGSEHVLLMGQVPGDASLTVDWVRSVNIMGWLVQTKKTLEAIQPLPVRVRHHPIVMPPERSLEEDLAGAACVVTWNSTSGVDAVMAGKPVIALDEGSMVFDVAGHSLEDVLEPPMPDREQWLCDLVYAQWNAKEMASGKVWSHISQGLK